jgi:rhodanese-related sulfurtransferase
MTPYCDSALNLLDASAPVLDSFPVDVAVGVSIKIASRRIKTMAPNHPPRFLKIVDDARTRIRETNVDEVKSRLDRGDKFILVDVREESEWAKDHLPGAIHMGKGVIERDVEAKVPDLNAEMVLYCGGGFRSALVADNLQKMGYTNVISMDGGIRGWREKGYPLTRG